MISGLGELVTDTQDLLWMGFVVFLRISAIAALLPGFGERTVPTRIKLVMGLAFTLIVAPAISPNVGEIRFEKMLAFALTETLIGLALGIGIRLFILALQTAGSIAAQATSLSQILGGAVADPMPAMGYILLVGGLALAMISGLHVKAAMFMILSYEIFPIGVVLGAAPMSQWGIAQIAQAFSLAFTLAAPFLLLSVLYNIALGAINKAMPQLMVAFVGAPLITAGGLFVLLLASPVILDVWLDALDHFLANPLRQPR